ncbi:hypothetical protein [Streptococcus pneumoniae]|uniref:hypothetical protein n=1 Tax=Streptococcus pneumoniae TaxID=1313 RepID=UPI0011561365|nr:hypothetical protein [Streptococcus pneumoniae]
MKIKEQTRKLAAGCSKEKQTRKLAADCSKQSFEVMDRTDEVSSKCVLRLQMELMKSVTYIRNSKHCFEVADRTDEVSHIYTERRS